MSQQDNHSEILNEDTRTAWEMFQDRLFIALVIISVLVVIIFAVYLISGDTISSLLEASEEGIFWQNVGN